MVNNSSFHISVLKSASTRIVYKLEPGKLELDELWKSGFLTTETFLFFAFPAAHIVLFVI